MPILRLTDICKDYQQGKEPVRVLKNINLIVEEGDYIAIMGPSGSGKTTLMNLIGCLDVPTSGQFELNGQNLKDLDDDALAEIRNKHLALCSSPSTCCRKWTRWTTWRCLCCMPMSP